MFEYDTFTFSDNVSRLLYIVTAFFNSVLIYLTCFQTKQIVGTYRNMIVIFALIGIWFTTLDILVRPLMHSYNSCLMFFTLGGTFRDSKTAKEYALLVYSTMYGIIITFLAVQFKYRTCVLAKPKWTKFFDGWKLIFWMSYILLVGIIWAIATWNTLSNETSHSYLRNEVFTKYGVDVRNVAYFAIIGRLENEMLHWKSFGTVVTFIIGISIQYSVCMVCGIIMYRRIEGSTSSTSNQFQKLQHQFFKSLLYQIAAPFICFHLPCFFLFVLPFFNLKISFRSTIVIYGFAIYPVIDSLILLTVISDYKFAVRRIYKKSFNDVPSKEPRTQYIAMERFTAPSIS